jgi:hypothetical protein
MSVEVHAAEVAARQPSTLESAPEPGDGGRPNVFGDLTTLFEAGPMFRRAVAGYDRFQVDTYVRWAEEELATARRESEHLMARHVRTQVALEEARAELSHCTGGREFLQVSRRIGSMLAAAVDEAEGIRAAAEADRAALSAQAEEIVASARHMLADARVEAVRLVAEAATEGEWMTTAAGRALDDAEQTRSAARAEADERLAQIRLAERCAAEQAEETRRQGREEVAAARLQARDDVVRMLDTGRQARLRADAEAAAARERLMDDAATRHASLLAEVEVLERRLSATRADGEPPAGSVGCGAGRPRAPLGVWPG